MLHAVTFAAYDETMRTRDSKHGLRLIGICVGLAALFATACSDDGGTDAEGTQGETAESGETDSNSSETDGESNSGDGDGDPTTGDGDPTTGDGDPTTGDGDPTGDGDGDPGGDGDPMPSACADYEEQAECEADAGCQAVTGQPLKENGQGAPCLEPVEFIGCIAQMGCGDAETWFCVGGNGKPVLIPDTCGPEGAMECDPGVDNPPECP